MKTAMERTRRERPPSGPVESRTGGLGRVILLTVLLLVPGLARADLTGRSGYELGVEWGIYRVDAGGSDWGLSQQDDGYAALTFGWHEDPWTYSLPFFGLGFRGSIEWVRGVWRAEKLGPESEQFIVLRDPSSVSGGVMLGLEVVPKLILTGPTDFGWRFFQSNGMEGLRLQIPVGFVVGAGHVDFNEKSQSVELNTSDFTTAVWGGVTTGVELSWNLPLDPIEGPNLEFFLGLRFNWLFSPLCSDASCQSVDTDSGPMFVGGMRVYFGTEPDQMTVEPQTIIK